MWVRLEDVVTPCEQAELANQYAHDHSPVSTLYRAEFFLMDQMDSAIEEMDTERMHALRCAVAIIERALDTFGD